MSAGGQSLAGPAPGPDPERIADFAAAVLRHYSSEGRVFPWRETGDAWRILVSEFMLQQTQTARVVPKYLAWFERFPDLDSLAAAKLADVYAAWKGLGYNSRALRLRDTAKILAEQYGSHIPEDEAALCSLPGIGRYTARAIRAFAFNLPGLVYETNIRSALIFAFFDQTSTKVNDVDLAPFAQAAMTCALGQGATVRDWYYALMDYGVFIKQREVNPNRKSAAYTRQSRFEGSLRQARGAILRALSDHSPLSAEALAVHTTLGSESDRKRLEEALDAMNAEGLVVCEAGCYRIAD